MNSLKTKSEKTAGFIIATRIRYLEIDLTKEVQDCHIVNYKILLKET